MLRWILAALGVVIVLLPALAQPKRPAGSNPSYNGITGDKGEALPAIAGTRDLVVPETKPENYITAKEFNRNYKEMIGKPVVVDVLTSRFQNSRFDLITCFGVVPPQAVSFNGTLVVDTAIENAVLQFRKRNGFEGTSHTLGTRITGTVHPIIPNFGGVTLLVVDRWDFLDVDGNAIWGVTRKDTFVLPEEAKPIPSGMPGAHEMYYRIYSKSAESLRGQISIYAKVIDIDQISVRGGEHEFKVNRLVIPHDHRGRPIKNLYCFIDAATAEKLRVRMKGDSSIQNSVSYLQFIVNRYDAQQKAAVLMFKSLTQYEEDDAKKLKYSLNAAKIGDLTIRNDVLPPNIFIDAPAIDGGTYVANPGNALTVVPSHEEGKAGPAASANTSGAPAVTEDASKPAGTNPWLYIAGVVVLFGAGGVGTFVLIRRQQLKPHDDDDMEDERPSRHSRDDEPPHRKPIRRRDE